MENVVEMSWRELNYIFIFFKFKKKREGWRFSIEDISDYDLINEKQRQILLRRGLSCYQRDVTVFHEFSHIFYDYIAGSAFNKSEKEIIAEWTARRTRRNHKLLRHAIRSFGLEPSIYDASSYKAFSRNSFADLEYKFKVNMMGNMS